MCLVQTPSRFGLSRNSGKRGNSGTPLSGSADSEPTDFSSKLLHLAWHPHHNIIAAAASNSLYLYCQH